MTCPRCSGLVAPNPAVEAYKPYQCVLCKREYREEELMTETGDPVRPCLWGTGNCIYHAAEGSEYCAGHRAEAKRRDVTPEVDGGAADPPAVRSGRPPKTVTTPPRVERASGPVTVSVLSLIDAAIATREAQGVVLAQEIEKLRWARAVLAK